MDIESKAVSAINDCIANTSKLKSYITQNDKTPLQDGCINVYGKNGYKKEDLIFAVPVQVKGKTSNKFEKHINYSIDIPSLNFFLNKGGALFFVVAINPETNKTKIYYASLLPYKIKMLLKDLRKSQQTKNVTLKRFPENEQEMQDLFLNFIENSKKQAAVQMTGILSLEELKNKGEKICKIESFYVTSDTLPKYYPDIIFEKEMYQYAVSSTGLHYPIAEISLKELTQTVNKDVICDGEIIYNSFLLKDRKDNFSIILGECLTLTKSKDNKKTDIDVTFTPKGSISNRIKATNIFLKIINGKDVYIKSTKIIEAKAFTVHNGDKISFEKYIKALTDLKEAINLAGIKEEQVEDKTLENPNIIQGLINVFLSKKPIKINNISGNCYGLVSFNNLKVLVYFEKDENDTYKIFDFFKRDLNQFITGKDGINYETSIFTGLLEEHFEKALNIPYENMLEDIKKCPFSIYHHQHTTLMLLEMIKAFDKTKNNVLYKTMLEIAEWLNNADVSGYDKHSSLINYLQCKKRKSKLSDDDKYKIMNILEDDLKDDYKLAGFILLDMKERATQTFNSLDKETKENFIKYPIYTLYTEML